MNQPAAASNALDRDAVAQFVDQSWEQEILPQLIEYIRIPNKSPLFDPDWQANGYMEQAVQMIAGWCEQRPIAGLKVEVVRLPERTPVIFMEIPATETGGAEDTVLLYGHLDKQPEMEGWRDGLGPWLPVREGDKLYGRGGADDGYAAYASLTAIEAVQRFGGKHTRCVVVIEACEESGSYDLPHYIEHLKDRIGTPSLVVCLDSGAGNYDQLWSTTSLRGMIVANLKVEILTEGVHSGGASGIVPSSFRIARQLLSRLENEDSGEILLPECQVEIPQQRVDQAQVAARELDGDVAGMFPFVEGARAVGDDPVQHILANTWKAMLSVTGMDGVPAMKDAGNVLRPYTALKLSLRVPPTCDVDQALAKLEKLLTEDPPYGAKISFVAEKGGDGWNAPPLADWLAKASDDASMAYFGRPACSIGEGGSIPFIGMLGERFPEAQFLITGLLGPASNAHGPNEFLHIPCGKRLTSCVADVLNQHAQRG
ncbi:MAG: M20/M25/M40 family metallo-hydrolase [Planctomycetota bacterium]|nr:MAG: M20/M25/M40 family metallo-hydrolase [Planctomycetota bacterium]